MTTKYITIPYGKQVRLSAYVWAWKTIKRTVRDHGDSWLCPGWQWYSVPAGEVLRDIRAGVADRINKHLPWYGRGRKWDADWQRHTSQAARMLNQPRLRIHWLPYWLKARFAERLARE